MRPTDGCGGNMAFEDAIVMCRLFGNSSLLMDITPALVESTLDKFERDRLDRVKKVHDNQRLRYEARMKGEKVGPWSSEFREWINGGV